VGYVKTTIDLPDALMKQVKLRALREGKKFKDTVAETLRAGLAVLSARNNGKSGRHKRVVIRKDRKTGLLVVRGSADAPARRMTSRQLLALEHEALMRDDLERAGISF
jgi:hypothetical protein